MPTSLHRALVSPRVPSGKQFYGHIWDAEGAQGRMLVVGIVAMCPLPVRARCSPVLPVNEFFTQLNASLQEAMHFLWLF